MYNTAQDTSVVLRARSEPVVPAARPVVKRPQPAHPRQVRRVGGLELTGDVLVRQEDGNGRLRVSTVTETLEGDRLTLGQGHVEELGVSVHVAPLDHYVHPLDGSCV